MRRQASVAVWCLFLPGVFVFLVFIAFRRVCLSRGASVKMHFSESEKRAIVLLLDQTQKAVLPATEH